MTPINNLKQSLADIISDIEILERQKKEFRTSPNHEQHVAAIFNARSYIITGMLDDLKVRKLDMEAQIREMEGMIA